MLTKVAAKILNTIIIPTKMVMIETALRIRSKTDSREVLEEGGRAMDAALAALFCNGRHANCSIAT